LRDRVLDREPTVGCWVSLASPAVAELLAAQPVDSVVRDVEHTEATVETVGGILRGVDGAAAETEALVRLPVGAGSGRSEQRFYDWLAGADDAHALYEKMRAGYEPGAQRALVVARTLRDHDRWIANSDHPDLVEDSYVCSRRRRRRRRPRQRRPRRAGRPRDVARVGGRESGWTRAPVSRR
jgi:hypothetical protein